MNSAASPEDRILSISKEMSANYRAVKPGDVIAVGLERDAYYPFADGERPRGVVEAVEDNVYGRSIQVDFNGHKEMFKQTDMDPEGVWSLAAVDAPPSGSNNEVGYRSTESDVSSPIYRAVQEVASAISDLSKSTEHTTGLFVRTMAELGGDITKAMDASGIYKGAEPTFSSLLYDTYMKHGDDLLSRGTAEAAAEIKGNEVEMLAQVLERGQKLLEQEVEYRSNMVEAATRMAANVAQATPDNPNSFARHMMGRVSRGFNYQA